jgi:hypothetical protein
MSHGAMALEHLFDAELQYQPVWRRSRRRELGRSTPAGRAVFGDVLKED